MLRLAIKAQPERAGMDVTLRDCSTMVRAWRAQTMPSLLKTIAMCNDLQLPIPVIFSCEKYLATALALQDGLRVKYFGVQPIIVTGNPEAAKIQRRIRYFNCR